MATLESGIRRLCVSLLQRQEEMDRFDFVQDFGARIPAAVIADLLGVPPSEQELVRTLIDQTFHLEPDVGMANEQAIEALGHLNAYFSGQLIERKTQPREDLFTELIEGEIIDADGTARRLTLEEATSFALLLASAGTETVARLIGWAGLVLSDHADQRAELVADPDLIGAAVEELLRYEPPSPVQGRWTTRAVELHHVTIPADSKVLLLTGSAGRDERHFADPDRFDIHRTIDHHVSFGYGIHFCLGAALARLEGRVALEEVLRRFPAWTVDKGNAVALHTSTVRGYSKLPVLV
jgi:cytochrome P450